MKVRWTAESVRFRITPTELRQLESGEPIVSAFLLPGGGWRAIVEPTTNDESTLRGVEGTITLYLSPVDVSRLADPNEEGVYFQEPLGDSSNLLRYYIEKDFPCVHPRPAEAQEDTETFTPPVTFKDQDE
jgi:hypothetical protein